MQGALERAFAAHGTSVSAHSNFTVKLAAEPNSFHVLSWGSCPVLRTLDVERLIEGLRRFVGTHGDAPAGVIRTDFAAAVGGANAVLVTPDVRERLVKDERTLRRTGLSVLEAPWADIDITTAELVVTNPSVTVDDAGLDELRSMAAPARRADAAVPAGRYPLAGIVVVGEAAGAVLGRPRAAFEVVRRVASPIDAAQAASMLDALGGFTERVTVVQAVDSAAAREHVVRLGTVAPGPKDP